MKLIRINVLIIFIFYYLKLTFDYNFLLINILKYFLLPRLNINYKHNIKDYR